MRPEKQLLLDEIKSKMDASHGMIVTSYQQLGPQISWNLCKQLSENDSLFEVVKKRIFLKATQEMGLPFTVQELKGHVGIVFISGDVSAAAKTIFQFSKENDDIISVLTGRIDGDICSSKDLEALSKLPSKDEMRAQFLGLIESPMSQTLAVMDSLLTSIIHCLENKSKLETKG